MIATEYSLNMGFGISGGYYLSHSTPCGGTGEAVGNSVMEEIEGTALEKTLKMVGSDSTASMTGAHNGAIRCIEEIVERPLQWAICLLHLNELPLRHVFIALDGTSKSPDAFSGPIGSQLGGFVSEWGVVSFKRIPNNNFPILPNEVIDDLSTDQYCAY